VQGTHHNGASTSAQYKFSDYFETSAKTGEGVAVAMGIAVEQVSTEYVLVLRYGCTV